METGESFTQSERFKGTGCRKRERGMKQNWKLPLTGFHDDMHEYNQFYFAMWNDSYNCYHDMKHGCDKCFN